MARLAAREANLLRLAKEALTKLIETATSSGDLLPRRLIFKVPQSRGSIEKQQTRVLKTLEIAGAVTSVRNSVKGGSGGIEILWGVNKPELCSALLADEVKLSTVLWPPRGVLSGKVAAPPLGETTEAPSEDWPIASGVDEPVAPGPEDDSSPPDFALLQEAMLAILQTVKRVGEGVAAMNERLGRLEQKPSVAFAPAPTPAPLGVLIEKIERIAVSQNHTATVLNTLAESVFVKDPAAIATALMNIVAMPRLGEAEAKNLREGDELYYHHGPTPEPVKVVNVRREPGHPITITVSRPGGQFAPVTPKFLSRRHAA